MIPNFVDVENDFDFRDLPGQALAQDNWEEWEPDPVDADPNKVYNLSHYKVYQSISLCLATYLSIKV